MFEMNIIYSVTIVYFLFFLIVYLSDRRRLINGFLFIILMFLCGLSLVLLTSETGSTFLFFFLAFLAVLLALFLTFGLVAIAILSLVNTVVLVYKEGFRFSNLLGLFVFLGIALWMYLPNIHVQDPGLQEFLSIFYLFATVFFFYFVFLFGNFLISSYIYRIYLPLLRQDYIIVLGSGLLNGDEVPPLLKGRIDRAIDVYKRQLRKKKKAPVLIMTGGQGADELLPEGEAMMRYAVSQGVLKEDILVEDKAKNTYENMLFSKELILEKEGTLKRKRILFATTNYHVFRAGIYAKKAGLKAHGIGSKTKFYFWYNALLREYVATIVMHKKLHIALLGFMFLSLAALLGLASYVRSLVY